MARKENRLKIPELAEFDEGPLVLAETMAEEIQKDNSLLMKVYSVNKTNDAKTELMLDIIYDNCKDVKDAPNSMAAKRKAIERYRNITGLAWEAAAGQYKSALRQVKKIQNVALLANYGACVKVDVIEKLYAVLEESEKPGGEKLSQMKKLSYYKALIEAADSITNMAIKDKANEINVEKNKILDKKVDSDNRIGSAAVALQIEGVSREDKERLALDALFADKTMLNPIFDQIDSEFKAEDVTDDD